MTSDCQVETRPRNHAEARAVLAGHRTHSVGCLQYLLAEAVLSADRQDVE